LLKGVNARIRQVRESFDRIVHEETQEERDQRDATQHELNNLAEQRRSIDDDLAKQRKEIAALEEQLEDLRVGRRLYSFIQERAESAEYRDKLGIIARIRDDFQTLSELVADNSQEKRNRWQTDGEVTVAETEESVNQNRTAEEVDIAESDATGESEESQKDREKDEAGVASIDRIVLYIDDLDRCPPERVVEVLQAVHLLLAFKLFVVVVAVDSRWLLRSLEDQYPEFLSLDREIVGQKEIARWASTPQNYLEKIFQIALAIKPMNEAGYLQLLDDLVGPAVTVVSTEGRGRESDGETGEDRAVGVSKPDDLPTASDETAARKVDLNPPGLEITQHEVNLMRDLFAFLGTPRAVKRFVNTYRIIRASLSPKELHDFETENSNDPVAVLVLLALLSGTPMEATWVFQSLDTTSDQYSWEKFVKGLEPQLQTQEAGKTAAVRQTGQTFYKNAVCSTIYSNAVPRWLRIWEALTGYGHITFTTVAPLRKWVGRVARCAFYPFRLESASDRDWAKEKGVAPS
ncbi:MAG: P-loop NTPase fold protein, partial [candidate division Zixibacteria bacterium]